MKNKYIVGIALALAAAPMIAGGAQLVAPVGGEGNVVVGPGDFSDLYTAGNSVTISSPIKGDLFAAGAGVTVSGRVSQDVFAAGANIVVTSPVGGDARLAGSNLTVTAPIGEDLLAAGATVTLTDTSAVGGDLWAAGGNLVINAPVAGNVKIGGGSVLINSRISGATIEIYAQSLTFGPQANVSGKITYHGAKEAVISAGAVVSTVDFQKFVRPSGGRGLFTIGMLIGLVATMLAAFLLMKFFGQTAHMVVETGYRSVWKSLGIGLAGIIVIPVLTLLLFITTVGFYVGLVLGAWFVFALLITGLMSVLFTGSVLMKWFTKGSGLTLNWQAVILGALVVTILKFIPIIGWIICAGITLISFGAVLQTVKHHVTTIHMHRNS